MKIQYFTADAIGKGAFKYYVIALGGGGGGPASIADADDALAWVKNQNVDIILERSLTNSICCEILNLQVYDWLILNIFHKIS